MWCNSIIVDWQIFKNFHNDYLISYNLFFTDADEELFEDNPDEYIRRDIEGSGGLCINKWAMHMKWYLTWSNIAEWLGFMVFNATFNNISVISWLSVLLVEVTEVPRENHRPVARSNLCKCKPQSLLSQALGSKIYHMLK